MATVASLDVNLGVRSREFTRELKRAQRNVRSFGAGVTQTFRRIGVATAAAVVGLAAVSRTALLAGDEVAKSARNAGLSAEAFQRLAESFRLGGSSARALVRGNQALLRQIRDFGRGLSTQTEAFGDLGLAFRDLRDLSPEEQFLLVRQRLSEMTDATQQSAIAQQLFGRAGKEFGTILTANNEVIREQGNRLQRLGGVIRGDLLGANELLVDQFETTSAVIRAQFINALLEAVQTAGGFMDLDDAIRNVGLAVNDLASAAFGIIQFVITWRQELGILVGTWIALRAVMFSVAAISALTTLVTSLKTIVLGIRGITLASIGARIAILGTWAAAFLGVAIAVAIGAAFVGAFRGLSDAGGAAVDFVVNKFKAFQLTGTNLFLKLGLGAIAFADNIRDFVLGQVDVLIAGLNKVAEFFGLEARIDPFGDGDLGAGAAEELGKQIDANTDKIMAFNAAASEAADAIGTGLVAAGAGALDGILSTGAAIGDGILGLFGGGGGPETAPGGNSEASTMAADMAETDTRTFWERITMTFNDGVTTGTMQLTTALSKNLSTAISQGNFDDLGDIFLSTIQQNLQSRVQEGLNEIFAGFFDGFLDSISMALSGAGGGGGGLGGLLSAGLGLFGFADGGIVPGRTGEAVPAVVHAGEVVLNREQQQNLLSNGVPGSNTQSQTINVTGDVSEATRRAVREMGTEIASMTQSTFQERGILNG